MRRIRCSKAEAQSQASCGFLRDFHYAQWELSSAQPRPFHSQLEKSGSRGFGFICPAVFPCKRKPANPEGVCSHAQSVSERMDGRARVVSPGHRHLGDLQFEVMRKVEDLRVKPPAMNLLQGK